MPTGMKAKIPNRDFFPVGEVQQAFWKQEQKVKKKTKGGRTTKTPLVLKASGKCSWPKSWAGKHQKTLKASKDGVSLKSMKTWSKKGQRQYSDKSRPNRNYSRDEKEKTRTNRNEWSQEWTEEPNNKPSVSHSSDWLHRFCPIVSSAGHSPVWGW